jgi:putative multiple sugar transport system ATP-binding protein
MLLPHASRIYVKSNIFMILGDEGMSGNILEMKNITKLFPGVKALDNVNLTVKTGEIHALIGENGAGKSTLINVLGGIYPHGTYTGDIIFDGNLCTFKNISDSEKLGIAIIHQELALIPFLTIGENIFLRNERSKNGIIDWDATHIKAKELLKKVGLHESTQSIIAQISIGKQQLVEIAKALSKDVKLLILDEPTASLNEDEANNLLKLLLELKKEGITSILISHKLKEVTRVADTITVIRDGATIETLVKNTDDISEDNIIKGMVGRKLTDLFPKRTPKIGEVAFEVHDWNVYDPVISGKKVVSDVNFNVRKGEILGFAGLMGAGRTELSMSIFGKSYGKHITGRVLKGGTEIALNNVRQAINHGISYATEDRKSQGLNLLSDIKENITIAGLNKLAKRSVINVDAEIHVAEDSCKRLNIKTPNIFQKCVNLSGGNQQKVVLSKWIFTDPELLILDEPTRGIDVGAKYEIYTIMNKLADEGKSIIFISSEMSELLGMCDRVYVMNQGRMVGELSGSDITSEAIMKSIMQSDKEAV